MLILLLGVNVIVSSASAADCGFVLESETNPLIYRIIQWSLLNVQSYSTAYRDASRSWGSGGFVLSVHVSAA